ncbi:MAG: prepilin-type N-terminal cleavage/methylation domain-containing protein [Alphaproteobacteria bacterium]|nr:prepilin-type N-terminal cleavage/methylation domain-containing protein [Alphaproteobacteria bacterium]
MRKLKGSPLRSSRAGFSLVELMIVIAIFVILTAVGIDVSKNQIPRWKTRRAAAEFEQQVQTCRNMAMHYGRRCRVVLADQDSNLASTSSQAGAYLIQVEFADVPDRWDTLPVDSDVDGNDDVTLEGNVDLADKTNQFYKRNVSIAQRDALYGPGAGENANAIVFDTRGFVANPNGDFDANGAINVTFANKLAHQSGVADNWTVAIGRAGLTSIESMRKGDEFENAGVTTGTSYASGSPFGAP